ncbi:MAG: D-glycero-beta-D-manno-heptose-7-phosphate kinase [Alphaproteobacteria bacterium]|nr:D-glycero-beta-D-manno-heptose-7-phosphate kinase [Alphaproteobacteria bacterium]
MTDRSDLAASVEAFAGIRVLCVGDVMLDRFVHGQVERISPEAPIPVLRVDREISMLGAAGNVVRNLVALGVKASALAVVGDDEAGHAITGLFGEIAEVEPHLIIDKSRATTIKTRYFGGGQQLLRTDRESPAPVSGRTLDQLVRRIEALVPDCTAVVLSDYAKGVLVPEVLRSVVETGRAANVPVVVDPKGRDFDRYRGAAVLTPNRRELADASGLPTAGDDQVAEAAQAVRKACGIGAVLATRGADGMTLVEGGGRPVHLPAEAREVFDVSGAGDTVVASVAAALGAGVPLVDGAALANVAAGIVVGKTGTAVAGADELITALHTADLLTGGTKVVTLAQALERVEGWRRKRVKVGFTNGCFDLLHPGHISLLAQARRACDRLIVGLNSDASVTRLKGDGRPVQSEAARAQVLASLSSVDLVVIFPEDTPMALIKTLHPDVLIKGADYAKDEVVGGDFVEGYGGRVLLADLLPGFSTSETIARAGK